MQLPSGGLLSLRVSITSISEAGHRSTEVTATCEELNQLLQQGAARGKRLGAEAQQQVQDMAAVLMDFAERVAVAGQTV